MRPVLLHLNNRLDNGEPAAWVVEAHILRAAMADIYGKCDDIEIMAPARVTGFAADSGGIDVCLEDGSKRRAGLLVACDGRSSALREQAGIGTIDWPVKQWGIVATIAHSMPHSGRAVQNFLPSGPFAVLPLVGRRVSLVWTDSEEMAHRAMEMSKEEFLAEAEKRMGSGHGLGRLETSGPRKAFPLSMLAAKKYVAPRLALAGDAAHGMHWIAGQGLNYGLRDVAALAETIVEARRLGLDIGSPEQLARYERWRRFDALAFTAAMAALNSLFSSANPILRAVRDIGLGIAAHSPLAAGYMVREAAGLTGNVPKMLRGEMV